jgi:hypothetical protein
MSPDAGIMSWEQADQIIKDQRAEIERLREAIRRLADQDATLSVRDGNVTVEMDATLTDAEREAIETAMNAYGEHNDDPECETIEAALWGLLDRTK